MSLVDRGEMSERTTCLRPEHLGEPLVAALLARIDATSGLVSVPMLRPSDVRSAAPAASATLATALVGLTPPFRFVPDARLAPINLDGAELAFDGKSRVDVAILDAAGTAVLIELKLGRSEEHTSELQSRQYLVCRLLLEKKKK